MVDAFYSVVGLNHEARRIYKKNIKNFFVIHLKSDVHKIIKLKKKMKVYKKKKNILGIDIKPEFPTKPNIKVFNNFKKSVDNLSMTVFKKINHLYK